MKQAIRASERELARRRDRIDRATERIRQCRTSEQVMGVVLRLAEELPGYGDLEEVVKYWSELIADEQTSHRLKITSLQTLAHMMCVAASERLQETARLDEVNPVDFAERLHEQKRLVPLIRALLADGVITLDDIDPPPSA